MHRAKLMQADDSPPLEGWCVIYTWPGVRLPRLLCATDADQAAQIVSDLQDSSAEEIIAVCPCERLYDLPAPGDLQEPPQEQPNSR
jgi:hypothetical protein